MAKNNFSSELLENYEQKCLCVLVLDISSSMRGKRIEELNKRLQDFYNEISADETTSQRLEVSIITFGSLIKTIQTPKLVEYFKMPILVAEYPTTLVLHNTSEMLVLAVSHAIDIVDNRKKWYKSTGQPYYRPWIILLTDGDFDYDKSIDKLSERIKQDTRNGSYVFLSIGVEDVDMDFLSKIQGDISPIKLQDTKFSSFFKWFSSSRAPIFKAEVGDHADISQGDEFYPVFEVDEIYPVFEV